MFGSSVKLLSPIMPIALSDTITGDGPPPARRPWSRSPTTARSRPRPRPCTPCSRTSRPTSPASSASSGRPWSTAARAAHRRGRGRRGPGPPDPARARRHLRPTSPRVGHEVTGDVAPRRHRHHRPLARARSCSPPCAPPTPGSTSSSRGQHHLPRPPAGHRPPRPRRRQPAGRRPRARHEPLFAEDLVLLAPREHPLAERESVSLRRARRAPAPPAARARRCAQDLDARPRRTGVSLRAQAEIDGVRLLASLAFEGYGPPSCPRPRCPAGSRATFTRIPVPELARRSVGWPAAGGRAGARRSGRGRGPAGRDRRQGSRASKGVHVERHRDRVVSRAAHRRPRPHRAAPDRRHRHGAIPHRSDPGPRTAAVASAMVDVALRARTPGAVQAFVEVLDDRSVVVVRIDASERRGALSSTASGTLAEAAARGQGPAPAPRRAHRVERRRHRRGHGRAARLGPGGARRSPTARASCRSSWSSTGPRCPGPALLLGLADLVVMTDGVVRVRQRADDGRRVHRACPSTTTSSAGAAAHARYSGAATLVVADADGRRAGRAQLLAYLPSHNDEEPPRWPTDDPPDRLDPRGGRADARRRRPAATTCAT